jgi:hypothetical protein
LRYTSPNAPKLVDVLGTWMLSILDGQWRGRRQLSCPPVLPHEGMLPPPGCR